MSLTGAQPMRRENRRRKYSTHHRRGYACLIRWPARALKATAWLVLIAYVSAAAVQPVVAAVRYGNAMNQQRAQSEASITPAERYGQSLSGLKQALNDAADPAHPAARRTNAAATISALLATLDPQRAALNDWWALQKSHMQTSRLAPEIQARQASLEQAWREKDQALQSRIAAVQAAATPADRATAQEALRAFLAQEIPDARANLIDHTNLPWQVQKNRARPPITDGEQLRAALAPTAPSVKSSATTAAQAPDTASDTTPDTHTGATRELTATPQTPASSAALPHLTRLTPALNPPAPPTASDLAATLDAPLTADIQAKATALSTPVAIYNWVHDNVAYFPSYGSAQGAQDTLDKLSGNDIDQASLLIAMLRSQGIPARYVYGTITLPADKVMNWVGGAQTANAAQQILGQGGVPNVALTSGGVVKSFQIEHVWVEAYVAYNPSRGAKLGPGDTWIPLDPSWKQYTFTQGMAIQNNVSFDANGFLTAAQQGATVNQAEGWVQNLNQANIQSQFNAYQTQIQNYVNATKANATVGDVLGTQQIKAQNLPYLPASTPYPVQTIAQRYSELPDSLRHHFRYRLYAANNAYGSTLMDWNVPTATIAGKKITMAWVAATQADADAIQSYLPKAHADGTPIQPSELPTSLPASINVKLELRVEGSTVATGGTYSLGTQLTGAGAFTTYSNLSQYDETRDNLIAGQQSALGVSVQGISNQQLIRLQASLTATRAKLQAQDSSGLVDESITGNSLTESIWGYFSSLQQFANITQSEDAMIDRQALSYGLFHAVAQPNNIFGIVTIGVSFKGVNMDVGHVRYIRWVRNDGDRSSALQSWISYNQVRGQHTSYMEAAVPELMFIDRTKCQYIDSNGVIQNPILMPCQQGVSAVKAIMIAAQQGQKIFSITQSNINIVLPQLNQSSSVIEEVRSAVTSGKIVTIHQNTINAFGWTGAGYTEIDPSTGTGAYLIEGKGNGGNVEIETGFAAAISLIGIVGISFGASLFFAIALALIAIWLSAMLFFIAYEPCGNSADDVAFLLTMGVAILGSGLGTLITKIGPAAMTAIASWIYSTAPGAAIGGYCGRRHP